MMGTIILSAIILIAVKDYRRTQLFKISTSLFNPKLRYRTSSPKIDPSTTFHKEHSSVKYL